MKKLNIHLTQRHYDLLSNLKPAQQAHIIRQALDLYQKAKNNKMRIRAPYTLTIKRQTEVSLDPENLDPNGTAITILSQQFKTPDEANKFWRAWLKTTDEDETMCFAGCVDCRGVSAW